MILIRSRLIMSSIMKAVKAFFTAVIHVFTFFDLSFALLVALAGVVIFLTGSLKGVVFIVYIVVLVASVVIGLWLFVRRIFRIKPKKHKMSIGEERTDQPIVEPVVEQTPTPTPIIQKKYPIYSKVKDHKEYIMAEFEDRYELYRREINGYKLVRKDFKE